MKKTPEQIREVKSRTFYKKVVRLFEEPGDTVILQKMDCSYGKAVGMLAAMKLLTLGVRPGTSSLIMESDERFTFVHNDEYRLVWEIGFADTEK